ncbi:MAG: septum formation initiator family protein [Actinomycetota bacterium]|nr:septum formation initiator family protein [Actinomycetota bacterium]
MSARAQQVRAAVRERAALRVVGEQATRLRHRPRISPLAVVAVVCVLGIVFGVLLERVMLAQSAFELTRLMERVEAADERRSELTFEVARRENPGRIEEFARTELGMVDPDPTTIEYIVAKVAQPRSDAVGGRRLQARVSGTGPASAAGAWEDSP